MFFTNPEFTYLQNFAFHFLDVFFCYSITIIFFTSTENFYLVKKQSKENFMKKKIVDSGIVKTCDELDLVYIPFG